MRSILIVSILLIVLLGIIGGAFLLLNNPELRSELFDNSQYVSDPYASSTSALR